MLRLTGVSAVNCLILGVLTLTQTTGPGHRGVSSGVESDLLTPLHAGQPTLKTIDVVLVNRHGQVVQEEVQVSWVEHRNPPPMTHAGRSDRIRSTVVKGRRRVETGQTSIVVRSNASEIWFKTTGRNRHPAWTTIRVCELCDRHRAFVRVGDEIARVTLRLVEDDGTPVIRERVVVVLELGSKERSVKTPSDYLAACAEARRAFEDQYTDSATGECRGHQQPSAPYPLFGTRATVAMDGGLEAETDGVGRVTVDVPAGLAGRIVVLPSPWRQCLIGRQTPLPKWALAETAMTRASYRELAPGGAQDLGTLKVVRDRLLIGGSVTYAQDQRLWLFPTVEIACRMPGSTEWHSFYVPVTEARGRSSARRSFIHYAAHMPGASYRVRSGSGAWINFTPGCATAVVPAAPR